MSNSTINIDLNKLLEYDLTIGQYLFLMIKRANLEGYYQKYLSRCRLTKSDIEYLLEHKWISNNQSGEFSIDTISLTEKVRLLQYTSMDWIDSWRDLFPKGLNKGGYRMRGDRQGCIVKMSKFMKENPSYDIELIYEATQEYLEDMKLQGYDYMKIAPYFISKDGVSTLAGKCEELLERQQTGEQKTNTENVIDI